jgi:hypothetical protein
MTRFNILKEMPIETQASCRRSTSRCFTCAKDIFHFIDISCPSGDVSREDTGQDRERLLTCQVVCRGMQSETNVVVMRIYGRIHMREKNVSAAQETTSKREQRDLCQALLGVAPESAVEPSPADYVLTSVLTSGATIGSGGTPGEGKSCLCRRW